LLDKLTTNKGKHSEELEADEIFGMHIAYLMRQIEDLHTNKLMKLKIQQFLFNADFSR
jgi:hypothetical protein